MYERIFICVMYTRPCHIYVMYTTYNPVPFVSCIHTYYAVPCVMYTYIFICVMLIAPCPASGINTYWFTPCINTYCAVPCVMYKYMLIAPRSVSYIRTYILYVYIMYTYLLGTCIHTYWCIYTYSMHRALYCAGVSLRFNTCKHRSYMYSEIKSKHKHMMSKEIGNCRVCCSVLQCVAVCCSVLQSIAVTKREHMMLNEIGNRGACCSVLQCVAVCCSVFQCAAVNKRKHMMWK